MNHPRQLTPQFLPLIHLGRYLRRPERLIELGLCASFALFFFWPHPPASLLLLGVAAGLAYARIEIAVALLPLTWPYYLFLQPLRASGFPAFSIGELGLLICLGVAAARNILRPAERRTTRAWISGLWRQAGVFLLPALLLLLGASLALFVSPDRHESLRAYRQEILEPLLYFLLSLRYLRQPVDLARTVGAFLCSAVLVACTGIIQGLFHLTAHLLFVDATTFRINGPYGSPNNLAFLLDRALPILLALAFLHLYRPFPAGGGGRSPFWREPLRLACTLAMIPIFWALFWTDSRGAEVAVLIVFCLLEVVEVRRWKPLLVMAGVGLLSLSVFWSHLLQFLNERGHGVLSERLLLWKAALLIIGDHVWLGTGLDSFNTLYNPNHPNSYALRALNGQSFPSTYHPDLSHPHNLILDFWISSGLLGLLALLLLLGAFVIVWIRAFRLCGPWVRYASVLRRLLLGLAGGMLAAIVHGTVDNVYFLPDLAIMFWWFLSVLLLLQGILQREQHPREALQKGHETSI